MEEKQIDEMGSRGIVQMGRRKVLEWQRATRHPANLPGSAGFRAAGPVAKRLIKLRPDADQNRSFSGVVFGMEVQPVGWEGIRCSCFCRSNAQGWKDGRTKNGHADADPKDLGEMVRRLSLASRQLPWLASS